MSKAQAAPESPGEGSRPGVLLVNLGSPAAPTPGAVRAFLAEFLSDPQVVDANPLAWWFVRNFVVLPRRSAKVARMYASIWTPEGSPLIAFSRRLRERLDEELGGSRRVRLAMRYGEPSIAAELRELQREGCEEVLIVPLFPQLSRSTTGSIEIAVRGELAGLARPPRASTLPPFYADPGYVRALAARVRESLALGPIDHHVFSFHGLPERFVAEGDPYRDHCLATARALAAELGLAPEAWTLVWQSRFGREEWLKPCADVALPELALEHPRILVTSPAFVCDGLETLEELGVRLRATFLAAGGQELRLTPCLNDHPEWVAALARLVRGAGRS